MKQMIIGVVLAGVVSSSVMAQGTDVAEMNSTSTINSLGVEPVANPFSLLDFSRIRWSHSYSVSFFSGGLGSGSQGLLRSTMLYDISNSLSLTFNLGIAHNAGAFWGDGLAEANLLPGFRLDYHPSDNFRMTVSYQRYMGYGSPYFDYGYGDWYGR